MSDPHRALIERYLAAYNAFDVEGMLALLDSDVTFENRVGGQVTATARGCDEFRRLAEHAATLFTSRRQVIRQPRAYRHGRAGRHRLRGHARGGPRAGVAHRQDAAAERPVDLRDPRGPHHWPRGRELSGRAPVDAWLNVALQLTRALRNGASGARMWSALQLNLGVSQQHSVDARSNTG